MILFVSPPVKEAGGVLFLEIVLWDEFGWAAEGVMVFAAAALFG